jgi:hypothetical protein
MKYVLIFVFALLMPFAVHSLPEPIILLTFDNVGDTAEDLSGNGNDGTLQADPAVVDGKFGDALEFQSSRVAVPASDSLSSELFAEGQFTVVMWISAARAGNTWQQIFRAGPDPNDTLFINNDGRLSWRGWVGAAWGGGMCETDPGVVEANTWTHAAVVSDGANFRIYVNGELSKESAFQETRGNNQEFMIGGYAGGESYSGAVDEFAIFAEPLEEADINSIMTKGLIDSTAVEATCKMSTSWGAAKTDLQ